MSNKKSSIQLSELDNKIDRVIMVLFPPNWQSFMRTKLYREKSSFQRLQMFNDLKEVVNE